MARINRTRTRRGSRRVIKKRMQGPVEDHLEEIKKVAAEIISEHKSIIVFLPDDEYLEQVPAEYINGENNVRNFIHNHVYEGDVDAAYYMNRGEKMSVNSLNGTPLHIEKNKKGDMFVNGMKLGFSMVQEKDGSKARVYLLKGVIVPGFTPEIRKEKAPRINPKKRAHAQAFRKYLKEELKKKNSTAKDRARAMMIAKKKADEEVRKAYK